MTFGEKLYQLRKQRGISQESLAQELNVSRQAISRWELNEVVPDTENASAAERGGKGDPFADLLAVTSCLTAAREDPPGRRVRFSGLPTAPTGVFLRLVVSGILAAFQAERWMVSKTAAFRFAGIRLPFDIALSAGKSFGTLQCAGSSGGFYPLFHLECKANTFVLPSALGKTHKQDVRRLSDQGGTAETQ